MVSQIAGALMQHYVMGVGIIRCTAEKIMKVYDKMYRLPQEKDDFLAFAEAEQERYEERMASKGLSRVE